MPQSRTESVKKEEEFLTDQAVFLKTEVAFLCHDYMVKDTKSENLRSLGQLFVCIAVGLTGLKVAGWVIVDEDHGGGSVCDNVRKYFAGMNRALVEKANRYPPLCDNLVCAVERDADEVLLLLSGNVIHQRQNILGNEPVEKPLCEMVLLPAE